MSPHHANQSRKPELQNDLNEIAEATQEEQDFERKNTGKFRSTGTGKFRSVGSNKPRIERGSNQRLEYELQQMFQHQELNRELKVSLLNQDDISEWSAQLFLQDRGEVNTINLSI